MLAAATRFCFAIKTGIIKQAELARFTAPLLDIEEGINLNKERVIKKRNAKKNLRFLNVVSALIFTKHKKLSHEFF